MAIEQVELRVGDPGTTAETVRPAPRHIVRHVFMRGAFAFALLTAGLLVAVAPVVAATTTARQAAAPVVAVHTIAATTVCANGEDDTPGLGLICNITVVNTITSTGGAATVTVHECHGAAGAPTATCTDSTQILTAPVTTVTQCNDSINGGGGTLRCSVVVTNNFVGVTPGSMTDSVNQCVESGGGITTGCNPFPATTTTAAVTQCNGSANGGTLVGLTCTVTGTVASAFHVTINQCNGSANGGGSLVICSAAINNATRSASATRTPPASSTLSPSSSSTSTLPLTAMLMALVFGGLGLAFVESRKRSLRS